MSLWNWLIPSIFGLVTITSLGLLLLFKMLFGGFRRVGGWVGGGNRHNFWKQKMSERMANMTDEEKEHFRAKMQNRWSKWAEKSVK